MRLVFIVLFIVVNTTLATAAPVVVGAPPNAYRGESITITGTGFGPHADNSPTEPYLPTGWEDFDTPPVSSIWQYGTNAGVQRMDTQQKDNSVYAWRGTYFSEAYTDLNGVARTGRTTLMRIENDVDSQILFISAHVMFPVGTSAYLQAESGAQTKYISSESGGDGNQYWNLVPFAGGGRPLHVYEDGRTADNDSRLQLNTGGVIYEGEWNRFDMLIDVTKPIGEKIQKMYCNGVFTNTDRYIMWEEPDCTFDCPRHFIGSYILRYFREDTTNYVWFDDNFINYTAAKVEISELETYDETTFRKSQIQGRVTSWSDTSITFNVNPGEFAPGVYFIRVFNADGSVNVTGKPITIGTAPPTSSGTVGGATIKKAILK